MRAVAAASQRPHSHPGGWARSSATMRFTNVIVTGSPTALGGVEHANRDEFAAMGPSSSFPKGGRTPTDPYDTDEIARPGHCGLPPI